MRTIARKGDKSRAEWTAKNTVVQSFPFREKRGILLQ